MYVEVLGFGSDYDLTFSLSVHFQFNEMLGYTNLKRDLMKNDFAVITALVLPYALKVIFLFLIQSIL